MAASSLHNRATGIKNPPACERASTSGSNGSSANGSSASTSNGAGYDGIRSADLTAAPNRPPLTDNGRPNVGPASADWRTRAACKGVDINVFFPPEDEEEGGYSDVAIDLCKRCPVRDECLLNALSGADGTNKLSFGYWGGTTPEERMAMIEALPQPPRPCEICGADMPEGRSVTAIYCSAACKRRARQVRAQARRAHYVS